MTYQILIKGKVQGVFFRASAKEKAGSLRLTGWVKNTDEGDVETVVTGTEEAVKAFIQWCHQGPAKARVTAVVANAIDDQNFDSYQVLR